MLSKLLLWQMETAERQWETGRRVRCLRAAELRSQLAAMDEQHARAEELVLASRVIYSQLEEKYQDQAGNGSSCPELVS